MTNAELAAKLRDLRDFLMIAGYEPSHATRYSHIARAVEKLPEPVTEMRREGRLKDLPGVGPLVQTYIKEILDEGVSSKQREWESVAPFTVVEMVRVPGLGPKTAQRLFAERGILSLAMLQEAVRQGHVDDLVGPKLRAAILATSIS